MKVSEIKPKRNTIVETPTDELRLIENLSQLTYFVADYGDVEVVYDSDYRVYRVPAFRDQIQKYCDSKGIYCTQNGCE